MNSNRPTIQPSRRQRSAITGMLSCICVTSVLGACDRPGECHGDYNDYSRGDRCQFQILDKDGLDLSTPLIQLTPAQDDMPDSATLLVTGKSHGAAADGYVVDVAIRGALAADPSATKDGNGCTSAFELAPASDTEVCTGVSSTLLHCVFNAVGQLQFTVSSRHTQPINGCSVIVSSGEGVADGAKLEIVYPLDALTLAARTPTTLGPCGDAMTPCVLPPVTSRAFCDEAPACGDVTQKTQISFATERGGQQIGSGQALDVQLAALPQTDDTGPLWFTKDDCTNGAPVTSTTIDANTGVSDALNACTDGRGGLYELRGTLGKGVVLTDSVFVEFPAQPPRVTGKLSDDGEAFEVHVLDCAGEGVAGANVGLTLEYMDSPDATFSRMTNGAGFTSAPVETPPPTITTVKLTDWDTSCIY